MVFKNKPHFQRISWCCTLFLAVVCLAVYAVDLYFNIALTHRNWMHHDYAKTKVTPEHIINEYMTQITPARWSLLVWPIIYGLLIIWFIYIFYLLLCRQLCSRDNKSSVFPGIFWFLFIIVNVLNGVWLYLFMHKDMLISGIVLLVLVVMLYALNMIAFRVCWQDVGYNDSKKSNDVEQTDDNIELSHCEVVLLRILTLNAFPLYAIWCSIAACLQWAIIFQYFWLHWSDNVASVVTLAILSAMLLIFWSISLLFKRECFVWTWLPSLSLLAVFIAIVKRHSMGSMHEPGTLFAFVLLIVTGVMILLKLVTLCLCHPKYNNNPRFSPI